jgi:hypothetical protein
MTREKRVIEAFRKSLDLFDGVLMKIGVLSDTHVPAIVNALPPVIFDIFKGVDLILHAGT